MFGLIGLEESEPNKVYVSEVIYVSLIVGICFTVNYFRTNISDIIDINGAVVGFFFIYLIPAVLHIKCLYFSRGKRPLPLKEDPEGDGSGYEQVGTQQGGQQHKGRHEPEVKQTNIEIIGTPYSQPSEFSAKKPESPMEDPLLGIGS